MGELSFYPNTPAMALNQKSPYRLLEKGFGFLFLKD